MVVLWQSHKLNLQILIMKKTIIQGLLITAIFFATWFVLAKVEWISIFKVQKVSDKTEEKLGELFWEIFLKSEREVKNPFIVNSVDSIVTKICSKNKISRWLIKIHLIYKEDINAFALPNGHLVVYSGLILNSENPEELSGIISHEIAHIQLNHVMKKLIKEIGLTMLISMTTGNGGSEIIKETAKMLSSSAFDRSLEKEADMKAVEYLINSKVNPEPFANFLYKLSDLEDSTTKYLSWLRTHPDSKERAEYIIEYSRYKKLTFESILSKETWDKLKNKLKD